MFLCVVQKAKRKLVFQIHNGKASHIIVNADKDQ